MSSTSVYEQKLSLAKAVIEQHNAGLPDNEKLSWEQISARLKGMGGTTDEALKAVSWEDLIECGIPRILARQIANAIFRKEEVKLTNDSVANMSFTELFQNYDPTGQRNGQVLERLRTIAKTLPCVVFDSNGQVDVATSTLLLTDLTMNLTPLTSIVVAGELREVYKIGEVPNLYLDENPLRPGSPLRRNGECPETGLSWTSIPLVIRQILYLALTKTNEIKISSVDDIYNTYQRARDLGEDGLKARYRKAALLLKQLQETNNAPGLRMSLKSLAGSGSGQTNDPFYRHLRT